MLVFRLASASRDTDVACMDLKQGPIHQASRAEASRVVAARSLALTWRAGRSHTFILPKARAQFVGALDEMRLLVINEM